MRRPGKSTRLPGFQWLATPTTRRSARSIAVTFAKLSELSRKIDGEF
jgi:hypothetical protein